LSNENLALLLFIGFIVYVTNNEITTAAFGDMGPLPETHIPGLYVYPPI